MQDVPRDNETLRGLDPTQTYPTLMRMQLAEAYAQGVPRKLELTGWGNISADKIATNWIQPDGSIPEQLQSFADFLFVNRRFLTDVEPDANVAVVYSMPTNVWESAPQWDRLDEEHANSFRGTCRALTDAHLPYDVCIFGHERLWNDNDQLTELTGYDAVILPGHIALGDRHEKALERVLDGGGSVVVSGAEPNRDEYFRRRSRDVFRRDRVIVLDDDPGRRYVEDGASADGLVQEVRDVATVSISSDRRIGVSRLRQRDVDRVVVHLVNYDWEEASDEVIRASDVEMSVADLPFRADSATYVSPQTTEELEVDSSKSGASVTIPSVAEWGFVVFAESRDDLRPDTTEKTAQHALEQVRERLSEVRNRLDTPSVWRELVRVELFVDEASLAFDSGAYTVAVERATHAEQSLNTLVESANVALTESPDQGTKTAVSTEHSTSSTETDTDTETETQTPGFTVGTAFTSAVGGLLALRRALAQTEDWETE